MTGPAIDKSPIPDDDDVIRNVRFKRPNWEKLQDLVEQYDRSPGWVVNKLIDEAERNPFDVNYPVMTADGLAPVSTFRFEVEFRMPSRSDCDEKAYEMLEKMTDYARIFALDDSVQGKVDHITPMMSRLTGNYAGTSGVEKGEKWNSPNAELAASPG